MVYLQKKNGVFCNVKIILQSWGYLSRAAGLKCMFFDIFPLRPESCRLSSVQIQGTWKVDFIHWLIQCSGNIWANLQWPFFSKISNQINWSGKDIAWWMTFFILLIWKGIEILDYIFNKLVILEWIQLLRINTTGNFLRKRMCHFHINSSQEDD